MDISYMKPERNIRRWGKKVWWYKNYQNFFDLDEIRSGIHSFNIEGLYYDIMVVNKKAKTTIFCFNSSIGKNPRELPVFTGNSMLEKEDVNRVYINDPSIYLDSSLKTAWYCGLYNGVNVQDFILKVLRTITLKLNSERNIFFGTSAGGFAALFYSWFFKDSLAYVINPQTNLINHTRPSVAKFAKFALGAKDDSDVDRALGLICSRLEVLYGASMINSIFYIQNKSDKHVEMHLNPFMEKVVNPNRVRIIKNNWGEGHKAPPPDFSRIMLKYINSFDDWSDALTANIPKEVLAFDLDYTSENLV